MDHISRILPRVLQKRGLATHAGAALAAYHARLWIAQHLPALKDAVRVTKLQDGVLFIDCKHPIAAQECQSHTQELLSFLRQQSGDVVKDIRLQRNKSEH